MILYAEVKWAGAPVMGARVAAHLTAIDTAGRLSHTVKVDLLDNGNGGELVLLMCTISTMLF